MSMPAARSWTMGNPVAFFSRCRVMITSWGLSTPDGGLGSVNFLNGVTQGATTAGSAASPGPGFLTGFDASKKQAASVRVQCQCKGWPLIVSIHLGRGEP